MGLEDEKDVPTIPFVGTIHRKYGIYINNKMKKYNLSKEIYSTIVKREEK